MIHDANCAITRWGDIRSWCDCGSVNEGKSNGLGNTREFRQAIEAAPAACAIRAADSNDGHGPAGRGIDEAGRCNLDDEEGLSEDDG